MKITKESLRKIIREALEEETGDRYRSENINKRTGVTSERMDTSLSKIEERLNNLEQIQKAQGKAIGSIMSSRARNRRRGDTSQG